MPKPSALRRSVTLPALLLLMLAAVSCSRPGIDAEVAMDYVEIATYEGVSNGNSVFTFRKVDDSPLITLTSPVTFDSDIAPGTRMLIGYTNATNEPYASGPVDLYMARRITQSAAVTKWEEIYNHWDIDPLWLSSMWRSGDYINLRVRLTYTDQPRLFALVLEPRTADTEWPSFYVAHIMAEASDYHDREYYASFDISDFRGRQGVKGVRVAVNDTNIGKQIFTFPF